MKVYTEDIQKLFNEAQALFQVENPSRPGEIPLADYYNAFTDHLNKETGSNLSSDTIYKSFYIRLKKYNLPTIGFSVNYLNALNQFVYKVDYTAKNRAVMFDDDEIPEFPYSPFIPCFPPTPSIKINIYNCHHNNVWIKDESVNPTGTHKDRMSWEIYLYYNKIIKNQFASDERINIPRVSIISSGNAALSIQHVLKLHGLPNLKAVVDKNIDKRLLKLLGWSGCEVYPLDLTKELKHEDLMRETKNLTNGHDLTFGNDIEELKESFYDWLSYEVLNLNPQHLFLPTGSGDLLRNILDIHLKEIASKKNAKRYFGNKSLLANCRFYGATTSNPTTSMVMLFSHHKSWKNDLKNVFDSQYIGSGSGTFDVEEEFVKEAQKIMKENGINAEASACAGLALFLMKKDVIPIDEKVVIINTGKLKEEIFRKI